MREQIIQNIDNPGMLERLYRNNRKQFRDEFLQVYQHLNQSEVAGTWYARLTYETETREKIDTKEIYAALLIAALAGFLAKVPAIFGIEGDFYFPRNIGFIVFPALGAFLLFKFTVSRFHVVAATLALIISVVFANLLPGNENNDAVVLSQIHMVLFMWFIWMWLFEGTSKDGSVVKRLEFIKLNGNLAVMGILLGFASGILSAMIISLFSVTGINIENFYMENVVPVGAAALPVISLLLVINFPKLVNRLSPLIARIFAPLVLIFLIIYLLALFFNEFDLFTNRDTLMVFNFLLAGVFAIVAFALTGNDFSLSKIENIGLFILIILAIIVNFLALSAIVFRISEWGFTINRVAVLGTNFLILIHLVLVAWSLMKYVFVSRNDKHLSGVITKYLPVYFIWVGVVVFLFPLLFDIQ